MRMGIGMGMERKMGKKWCTVDVEVLAGSDGLALPCYLELGGGAGREAGRNRV